MKAIFQTFHRMICVLIALTFTAGARAHKPSDSYLKLDLNAPTLRGQWDIALRDLEFAIGLDQNLDGRITWGELRAREKEIARYAISHLKIDNASARAALVVTNLAVERHSDGAYATLQFRSDAPSSQSHSIQYDFLFDLDAQHRGLLSLSGGGKETLVVFKPDQRIHRLERSAPARAAVFRTFVTEGIWHIWKGFDHLLFLLTLLLPAAGRCENGAWQTAPALKKALGDVMKVVTAFTLAHSITLILAALEIVRLPSALVETVIAASVVLAAINNLRPVIKGKTWLVAFGFGLIHGFGFANVFADLGVSGARMIQPLLAFNVGVELGQAAVVACVLPVVCALSRRDGYRTFGVQAPSLAVACVALTWTLERLMDFKVLPF